MTHDTLYILEVEDRCDPRLVGHPGCSYSSPPQSADQALALVRVLTGCATRELTTDDSPWSWPIAGGTRIIHLHSAQLDGQLHL